MKRICLMDTAVASQNLGDQVIMDAVRRVLGEIFPDAFYMNLATHEFLLWESYKIIRQCDHIFVGGSNLLKSRMEWKNQWKISPFDALFLRNCRLMATGWWHYQQPPDFYSRNVLRRILANSGLHSVRDGYTKSQLNAAGITNVVNTACVSMWQLTPEHCAKIPTEKAPWVATTVTGYNPDRPADQAIIDLLCEKYEKVWLWVQQPEDYEYGLALGKGRLNLITPNLPAYTQFMLDNHVDYIGSRLHGGIRPIQCGKRGLILAVDNRAQEISKDTGLPVLKRNEIDAVRTWIDTPAPTVLRLPNEAINAWRGQFAAPQAG